jgi:hypothetical protein
MEDFYKVIIYKVRYETPMRRLIATAVIATALAGSYFAGAATGTTTVTHTTAVAWDDRLTAVYV